MSDIVRSGFTNFLQTFQQKMLLKHLKAVKEKKKMVIITRAKGLFMRPGDFIMIKIPRDAIRRITWPDHMLLFMSCDHIARPCGIVYSQRPCVSCE